MRFRQFFGKEQPPKLRKGGWGWGRDANALFKPATHRPQFQERTAPGGERGEAVTH